MCTDSQGITQRHMWLLHTTTYSFSQLTHSSRNRPLHSIASSQGSILSPTPSNATRKDNTSLSKSCLLHVSLFRIFCCFYRSIWRRHPSLKLSLYAVIFSWVAWKMLALDWGKIALSCYRSKKSSPRFSWSFEQIYNFSLLLHLTLSQSALLLLSTPALLLHHWRSSYFSTCSKQNWSNLDLRNVCVCVCVCVSGGYCVSGKSSVRCVCVSVSVTQEEGKQENVVKVNEEHRETRRDTVWDYWPAECIRVITESSWATWPTVSGLRKGSSGRRALFRSTCYLTLEM